MLKQACQYILWAVIFALSINSTQAQCPGGGNWLGAPVNGSLKDSGTVLVLDTVNFSTKNPTFGSFDPGRPGYGLGADTWAGYPFQSLLMYRGGGIGASTTITLKVPADSNSIHFRISNIRGDGSNLETQRIVGYRNGTPVTASFKDPVNGAYVTTGRDIHGSTTTSSADQSSMRIFFDEPVDSVIISARSLDDFVIIELFARCDMILPNMKLDLRAVKNNNSVLLKWTAPLFKIYNLQLQRSGDGQNWKTIASVQNKDDQYFYSDQSPFEGTNYYRITATDANGVSWISNITRVVYQTISAGSTKIYPNPFNSGIHFSSQKQIRSYSIVGPSGNKIYEQKVNGYSSFYQDLSFLSLKPGLYYLSVEFANGELTSYKILQQQ